MPTTEVLEPVCPSSNEAPNGALFLLLRLARRILLFRNSSASSAADVPASTPGTCRAAAAAMSSLVDDPMMESGNACAFKSHKPDAFPCDASAIELVALGIGAGGLSLLFVYFLVLRVR
jgi:hypothetical protein